ncbi:Dcp1-like decapping [Penicillium cinerascens]|uniref:Dcp1-like decapping n=1 Tax=Penicillium cinerascens TaxID=70096 RepID=A0A9W9M7P5_9EURO|nr:Dcp1-like decapping [Penicillium cinerascens]KAJ5191829.1 Dcp1-like decapping [Penicillium cinerascens]
MTSRKPRRQNNNHNNTSHLTDYESDAAYLSDMQHQPAPPLRSNEELNLSVLQRHNPSITSILSLAQYSVVYIFSPTTRGWEKNGVEGTLFVCQLTPGSLGEDRYTAFVLNRRGLQNFDLPLTDSENVELTEEYVILKADEATDGEKGTNGIADPLNPQGGRQNGNSTDVRIYGIWIYSEPPPNSTADIRIVNAQMIRDCATHAGQSLKLARKRLEELRQNGMHVAAAAAEMQAPPLEEAQASAPMGRQMSLKDIFGQQRAQDDAWSVRAHHISPDQQHMQMYQSMMTPQGQPQDQHQPPPPPQAQVHPDVLGDLFRRAGFAYQGGGQGY